MLNIEFLEAEEVGLGAVKPVPAVKNIPNWFKSMPPLRRLMNRNNPDENPDFTIKKCIPVLDAFTAGYYLVTQYDAYWSVDEDGTHLCRCDEKLVEGGNKPITMHSFEQIRGIELEGVYNEYAYKFTNPYIIKTPPGYSTIFTHPFNRVLPFHTLTGVVDTDSHPLAVQFPFLMLKGYEGMIPKGTPIVQMIPFKREEWTHSITKPNKLEIQAGFKAREDFDISRYDQEGNPTGGEYKKKHRVKKKYL